MTRVELTPPLRRFQLPEAITRHYEYERDLSSAGAQADVVLCRDRSSGEHVAIKIYRPEMTAALEHDALASLAAADREHVVPFRLERDERQVWEIQEYFPLGSLEDLVQRRGGQKQSEELCRAVLLEVGLALDHIHGLGIVHRDLKPQNVLVRAEKPLDTVLADFGLARVAAQSRAVRSVAGTAHYTSPEGAVGRGHSANDWWGLGVIVHELLSGRHMFSDANGHYLSDNEVRAAFFDHSWSYADISDERWRLLLDGLLAPAEHRWSWPQVKAWLGGESPQTWPWPDTGGHGGVSGSPRQPYILAGGEHDSPAALAEAVRNNFMLARDHIAGIKVSDLMAWLHHTHVATAADDLLTAVRAGMTSPGRALVELQLLMDPASAPAYQDRILDEASLRSVIDEARSGDTTAAEWITATRGAAVLTVLGRYTGRPSVAHADELLDRWWFAVESILDQAHWRDATWAPLLPEIRSRLEGVLLAAALDARNRDQVIRDGGRALRRVLKAPSTAPGASALSSLRSSGPTHDETPTMALAGLAAPAWEAVEAERQKAEKRVAEEQDRLRREGEKAEAAQRASAEAQRARDAAAREVRARNGRDWKVFIAAVGLCGTVLLPWLLGRYSLHDGFNRPTSARVFDPTGREPNAYFLTDWLAGCTLIGMLFVAFVVLRPWRGRMVHVLLAVALGAWLVLYVAPVSAREWREAELMTAIKLETQPYPFDERFASCGSNDVSLTGADGSLTTYTLFSARSIGGQAGTCDRLELYRGWRRLAVITLPDQATMADQGIFGSNPVAATPGATGKTTKFMVSLSNGKSLGYTLSGILSKGAVDTQPVPG